MRLFRPPKPGAFCAAWSSTTPPSTPVGSTWSRSRSACCAASAWIAESTTQSGSVAKSQLGNGSEMPPAPASNGCSQPTKPAPKWVTHTPTHRKSHNHCAEVLDEAGEHETTHHSSASARFAISLPLVPLHVSGCSAIHADFEAKTVAH